MSQEQYPFGRLMFRQQGDFWNVYFGTKPDDAVQLGSIRMNLIIENRTAKEAFMKIFSDLLAGKVKNIIGQSPTMEASIAPEHERSSSS